MIMIINLVIIQIKNILKKTRTIIFKDSFLMLPISLRKLCTTFNVASPKEHFPFLLNQTFYKGVVRLCIQPNY